MGNLSAEPAVVSTAPTGDVQSGLRADQARLDAKVFFLGDSVIAQMDLDESFPELDAANRGIGRNTTGQMLQRLGGTVVAAGPSCVVLMGGVNDLSFGTPVDWMAHQLIADEVIASGAKIILVTTPQPAGGDLKPYVSDVSRREMNDFIRNMSSADPTRVLLADFGGAADEMGAQDFGKLTTDGYHLNDEGNRVLADMVESQLSSCIST